MPKVRIYGCGSIGNHLAHACRQKQWQVEMCDIDSAALERTKSMIYPDRYGKWDDTIQLTVVKNLEKRDIDIVIVGTPPNTHMEIALSVLSSNPPKIMMIEKPLATPDLKNCDELLKMAKSTGTVLLVGYNHALTENTRKVEELLNKKIITDPATVSARFREYWGGIFKAHPWLNGPIDSYLGFSKLGGGASGEHSHAIHIWQHMSHLMNKGKITEVSSMIDWVSSNGVEYDQLFFLNVKTSEGMIGDIIQDVLTEPAEKKLRIQGESGFIEWFVNKNNNQDAVRFWDGKNNSDISEVIFNKRRQDDFINEVSHMEDLLNNPSLESPISVQSGLDVMLVIAAAYHSWRKKRTVCIDYDKGYNNDAIVY